MIATPAEYGPDIDPDPYEEARLDEQATIPLAPKKKRKSSTSPTSRTMVELRKRGWTAQIVEHRVPKVNILRDLFGCIDVVALVPVAGSLTRVTLGIQATAGANNHALRRAKILAEPRAKEWMEAGNRLELWSWSKRGDRGKRKLWTLRVESFVLAIDKLVAVEEES